MKTPKTPLEFDYDLWTTEDGKCMVRIKATNEVAEVTREIMRLLRAEEKQMRRLHPAAETDCDTATLSLDTGDPQQGPSSWLADPSDFTQDIAFDMLEATFFQQLTTIQRDVYQAVIKDGLRPYDYAKHKGISPSAVTQHIQAIRRKAKKFF